MASKYPLDRLNAVVAAAIAALLAVTPAAGQDGPSHGIAMYGEPALPPDFVSLPYANPEAPQGGRFVFPEVGSFDSLNPFILRGTAPWGVNLLTVQSLLGRSYDEPFTLYAVLAESVETDSARSFVEFTLREGALFSDGSPVTLEDVIWSFETMGTEGHPRYRTAWTKIASMEQVGESSLRFTFTEPDRELPLILGLRPVVQRAQFDVSAGGRDFAESSLSPVVASGPYVVSQIDPGRSVTFRRVDDWWAQDLPLFRGQHNAQEIRYEYYSDMSVAFEALKAGLISVWREGNAARWADSYNFPAIASGAVRQVEVPHQRPSGMSGLFINTRNPMFADWRVREALILAFDFERINMLVTGGAEPRIPSYFGNSMLGMQPGPATGREAELLAPFTDTLFPGALEGYALPISDGRQNRRNLRTAMGLLAEAGWEPDNAGVLRNAQGAAFSFEILLLQGQSEVLTAVQTYAEGLLSLGIRARVSQIDSAQYVERTNAYAFDMTYSQRLMSLSPGNEQLLYWSSEGVETPGTRNFAGVNDPAVEAMISTMLAAESDEDFTAAVRALDRVLMTGRYAIPFWFSPVSRIAVARNLHFPDILPIYGDWTGFLPEVWWYQE
ncbi:MAG: extracellular solute-binding protein [Pararhodobacter sp.]